MSPDLTFGLELEMVLGFHYDLLRRQLDKNSDKSSWKVVTQPGAPYTTIDRDELLPSRTEDWDSYGIELVSPVMSSTEQATANLAAMLSTLHSGGTNPHHDVTTTTQCGLHVHIGTPTGQAFPLPVLQHLAFLHLVYEHELERLLPLHRRLIGDNDELVTNRQNFFAEGADRVSRQVVDPISGTTKTVMGYPTFVPLNEVRESIYATTTIKDLVKLMGKDKQHLVNFTYAARGKGMGPATVEFRAYNASTDVVEIEAWIKFCLGLVRLAYKMADGEVALGVSEWGEEKGLEGLWELMDLVEADRVYWREKVEEKALLWPDWRPLEFWVEDTWGDSE